MGNVQLQFCMNEIGQMRDVMDYLYNEFIYVSVEHTKALEELRILNDQRSLVDIEKHKQDIKDLEKYNINLECKNRALQLNLLDMNGKIFEQGNFIDSLEREAKEVEFENANQQSELISAMAKLQGFTAKSDQVEFIQGKLSEILTNINI